MRNPLQIAALLLLLGLLSSTALARMTMTQPQKIESLILSIQQLKNAIFIRNGSEYSAEKAAEHLRLKWKNAGARVKTAEDFIVYCATKSSVSGEKYKIRLADGQVVDSEVFLREKLKALNALDGLEL